MGWRMKKNNEIEEAKWFSDLETLKKHYSKFQRDSNGYLIVKSIIVCIGIVCVFILISS